MKFMTNGLIIKEQNIGEKDKLVTILTDTHGVVKAFARGAKDIKSPKCAATGLLSYSKLTLHKGKDSYIVGDAKSLRIFSGLRTSIENMCPLPFVRKQARYARRQALCGAQADVPFGLYARYYDVPRVRRI